jgi:uncharacterized protein YbcV (DUF1398 family)
MDPRVLEECNQLAFEGRITFPETVRRLLAAGADWYTADLVALDKRHHGLDGSTRSERLPLDGAPAVPEEFWPEGVTAALAAIQGGEIEYPEFLRRIMRAGTAYYSVFLYGRRAIYVGRRGEYHVEHFRAP